MDTATKITTTKAPYQYDLHMHSINSDGRQIAEEVIARGAERELNSMVFTDHHTVTWSEELVNFAKSKGISIPFPATEISTVYDGRRHHIIAFGFGVLNSDFLGYINHPNKVKNEVYFKIVNTLRGKGYKIPTAPDLMKGILADGSYRYPDKVLLSRTLIASYLADSLNISIEQARVIFCDGYNPSAREVEITEQRPLEERYLPTREVIRTVIKYGAVPVMAHPFWRCNGETKKIKQVYQDIATFQGDGLVGVEWNASQKIAFPPAGFSQWLLEQGFILSGGSDYHGNGKTELGQMGLNRGDFETLQRVVLNN